MAKVKVKNPEKLLTAFIFHREKAEILLKEILNITKDNMGYDPEEMNWGHVGTMEYVVEQLEVIAEHVGIDATEALKN